MVQLHDTNFINATIGEFESDQGQHIKYGKIRVVDTKSPTSNILELKADTNLIETLKLTDPETRNKYNTKKIVLICEINTKGVLKVIDLQEVK